MDYSITALIVTYNRKVLLSECLEAVLGQSLPVKKVLLIDNASTDGTKEYLEERGFFKDGRLDYMQMETNTGGSGGFYEGLKRFRETESQFVWLMDDDTIPSPCCLKKLAEAYGFLTGKGEKVSFVASSIYGPGGEYMNVPVISRKTADNGYAYWYKYLKDGLIGIESATFVSLLISKDAVKACGLPCRNYFIWGDDLEYTMRLTTKYADAYMSGESTAVHKRANLKNLDLSFENDKGRIRMHHYFFRNMFVTGRYYSAGSTRAVYIIKTIAGNLFQAVNLLKEENGFTKASTVLKGTLEGLTQYGKFKKYIDGELKKRE